MNQADALVDRLGLMLENGIVIPCLLFSLVESLNILPAHLAHPRTNRRGRWSRSRRALADGIESFVDRVRQAFYSEEAQRIQRGRDDIRVMVRYPADDRRSLRELENMRIRTRDADEVPFGYVAALESGRGVSTIRRVNRSRAISVTASLDETVTSAGAVYAALAADVMPAVARDHAGVRYSFEGSQADQEAVIGSLQVGFPLALFVIFALLAIPSGPTCSRSSS